MRRIAQLLFLIFLYIFTTLIVLLHRQNSNSVKAQQCSTYCNKGEMSAKKKPIKIVLVVAGLVLLFFFDDALVVILTRELNLLPIPSTFFTVILLALLTTNTLFAIAVFRILRRQPVSGREGMIGEVGKALTTINGEGRVSVHGEIWRARSLSTITAGTTIQVEDVEGLTLIVREC